MSAPTPLAHFQAMAKRALTNPATRTIYRGESAYDVTVDGIALTVHGEYEPADGDGINAPRTPSSVSINSVCWPGSDLCIYGLLSESAIDRIQDLVDEEADSMVRSARLDAAIDRDEARRELES